MRLDRAATLYVAKPLKIGFSRLSQLPILMYHSISETAEDSVTPYYRTVTRPDVFDSQMACLKENGWRGVTMREGLKALAKGDASEDRLVAITFDDGFEDFYVAAYPSLLANQFSATMYLSTGFVGKEFKQRPCMTWEQIRELHRAGVEFGSHTVNHPKLWHLEWPEIASELRDSKVEIENRLGTAAPSFAYPYAFPKQDREFGVRFKQELEKAGYQNCVTTAIGRAQVDDDVFSLKRLPMNSLDDSELLLAKLDGAYDWLAWAQSAVQKVKTALRR